MSERVVQREADGRFYVTVNRQKFYAPGNTKVSSGFRVETFASWSGDQRVVQPAYQWRIQNPGRNWTEKWQATQPKPPPAPRKGIGGEIKKRVGGANLVVIASDGVPTKKKLSPRAMPGAELYIAANGGMSLKWDQWDALVDEIDALRQDGVRRVRQTSEELEAEVERIRQRYLA